MKIGIVCAGDTEAAPSLKAIQTPSISATFSPLCVDMETASIAHVCYGNRIPYIAVRTVTDTLGKTGTEVFE